MNRLEKKEKKNKVQHDNLHWNYMVVDFNQRYI